MIVNVTQKTFSVLILFAISCVTAAQPSSAEQAGSYPNREVRIVVPFSPGSITDVLARVLADKLTTSWRQTVIVENRPGLPGTASVARSAADGYTLMLTSNGHTIAALVNKDLTFDPAADFTGVAQVASVPHALIVPPDFPAKTVKDFIALAKQNPGKFNFASAGVASTSYLAAEYFTQTANINLVHIPYKGAPEGILSVIRKESQLFVGGVNLVAQLHQTGKVFAMAVATAKRNPLLPDVPTVAESGLPGFTYDAWFGLLAPVNTPTQLVDKINHDVDDDLRMPDVQSKLAGQGIDPVIKTAPEFNQILKTDFDRYAKLWAAANSK
jgi:tripartite-type tricarboxylate transporter receptor subunit TctC